MLKRKLSLAGMLVLWTLPVILPFPLNALDFDFTVIGNGKDTPSELSVFRRGNGYVVSVNQETPGKEFEVYFDIDNLPHTGMSVGRIGADWRLLRNGSLEKYQSGKWIPAGRAVQTIHTPQRNSYYIGDKLWNLDAKQTAAVICRENGSSHFLPEADNEPLLINGYMRHQYSWNNPDSTILRQIGNDAVEFSDVRGDLVNPHGDDLISGSAEVCDGILRLTCRAAEPFKNPIRIWIDSIPRTGYGAIEADFMIERGRLYRYAGASRETKWNWKKIEPVAIRKGKNNTELTCEIPLNTLRNDLSGRIRVVFSSDRKGVPGDSMPTWGKIVPVLRPGNLATQKGTKVSVSSIYQKYKTFPLTDGQTARQIYYSFATWASANVREDHYVDFEFAGTEEPRVVTIWWEMEPREIQIQRRNGEEWQTLVNYQVPEKERCSYILLPKGVGSNALRILMPAGKGNKKRPLLLWIREIEIY